MPYVRPQADSKLSPAEKRNLLDEYYDFYREEAKHDPGRLNRKIDRNAFASLLNQVGELLLGESAALASQSGEVRTFLDENLLPESLKGRLPDDFRAFCLAINALKQWLAAEQAATDRYLLGGTARTQCRAAAKECVVSGVALNMTTVELHHPVRDGRPPVPVCKDAHASLEGQKSGSDDPLRSTLLQIKRKGNRSWVQLRRGCEDLLGHPVQHSTPAIQATARVFAREARKASAKSYQELLAWLDEKKLGIPRASAEAASQSKSP